MTVFTLLGSILACLGWFTSFLWHCHTHCCLPKGNWITFTLTDCYFQLHVIHELCQLPAGAVALPASPPLSGQLVHSKDAGWKAAAVPGALCRWLINVKVIKCCQPELGGLHQSAVCFLLLGSCFVEVQTRPYITLYWRGKGARGKVMSGIVAVSSPERLTLGLSDSLLT